MYVILSSPSSPTRRLTPSLLPQAAVVAVTGTADSYVGPGMFRSNTYGDGVCENPEGTDVAFPNPGDNVFYGGDYSSDDPPVRFPVSRTSDRLRRGGRGGR